jgi:Na+/melibiose symporter-like transporter
MAKPGYETKLRERVGYSSYFVGQNILYMFTTVYLSVYYSTALGISPLTVGTILLAARVWDAVMDPILSVFVEKSKLKGGKFKPWINSVSILVPLLTILMFAFTSQLAAAPGGLPSPSPRSRTSFGAPSTP